MTRPIVRAPTVADEVYRRLRHELLLGSWAPGTRLREVELTERFEVSRTPVREAVGRLLQEGLLESRHTQGVQVREPTWQDALDAYDVREDLEGKAARLAAERGGTRDKETLMSVLQAVEASAQEDQATQVEADLEFHQQVAAMSANTALIRALETISGHVTPLKVQTRDQNANEVTTKQHRAVAQAILAADGEAAERAMRDHIGYFRALLIDRFQQRTPGAQTAEVNAVVT
jgi:DNA-binding GntR family transcriptional regulator